MKYFSCRTSNIASASLEIDLNVRSVAHWMHISGYSRTPSIQINWDEPFVYAENLDNWIFSLKVG